MSCSLDVLKWGNCILKWTNFDNNGILPVLVGPYSWAIDIITINLIPKIGPLTLPISLFLLVHSGLNNLPSSKNRCDKASRLFPRTTRGSRQNSWNYRNRIFPHYNEYLRVVYSVNEYCCKWAWASCGQLGKPFENIRISFINDRSADSYCLMRVWRNARTFKDIKLY